MLTTSPVISSPSNNASPRSFGVQYGSTTTTTKSRSPRQQQQGTSSRRPGVLPPSSSLRGLSSSHQQAKSPAPALSTSSSISAPAQRAAAAAVAASSSQKAQSNTRPATTANVAAAKVAGPDDANDSPTGPPPPTPPGPRPLDDAQLMAAAPVVVAAAGGASGAEAAGAASGVAVLASSATLSPSKRRIAADSDEDVSRGGEAGSSTRPTQRPRQLASPPKVLPAKYEFCSVEDIVILISNMLVELVETNDSIPLRQGSLTRFHSRTAPGISVQDYLFRLARHATLTPPLLLSMVYYIDRLCAQYPQFTINTLTVHRFLITAATVAAKGLSDSFWNNTTYAKVGGVRVQELNLLELEFLHRVEWRIVPNPEVLVAYYNGLVERHPGYVVESSSSAAAAAAHRMDEGEDDAGGSADDQEAGDNDEEEDDEDDELEDSDSEDISDGSPEPAASMADSSRG